MALALAAGIAPAPSPAGCCGRGRPADPPGRSSAELMDVLMWNREPVGGPFALIDHTGRPRADTDFRGQLLLIYFGFTFCSDICPIDLQSMAGAVDQLGPAGDAVQPLFITVDPEKDTPEQLRGYVALFHPRLIGLTGDPSAIAGRPRLQGLLRQARPRRGHAGRSFRRGLFDRPGRPLRRLLPARHPGRPHGRSPAADAGRPAPRRRGSLKPRNRCNFPKLWP